MEKKLKVGLFIDCFYPMVDGVVQVVDQYATNLSKYCDVTVFTVKPRKNKQDIKEHCYKVVRCKIWQIPFLDYDLALTGLDKNYKKALKDSQLDIVHIHSPFFIGKTGVKYAKKHNIPVLATMHSQFKKDFYQATKCNFLTNIMLKKVMKIFNSCDNCYAVNEAIAKLYFEEYGAKVMPGVLLNGTEFKPVKDENLAKKQVNELYNLENDIPLLLFVGRLTTLKNIFFIANALKIIKDKGYKFKMMYVGTGQDEDKLKDLIKELELENEVIFTGKIMDRDLLLSIYARANLFLFPSLYDANSLVQIEAASQKTPTVFIEGSATSSTVKKDVNGYISPNSIEEYAETICNILDNPNSYNQVSQNAFNDLYRTWEEIVENTYNLYLEKIKEKKEN